MEGLDTVWRDAVFAMRLLRRSPIFTASAVLTIALGVGVNTAVFSVVNAFVLRPLPVRDGDRLAVVATQAGSSQPLHGVSFADLQDYRAATTDVFEDAAGYSVGFLGLAADAGRPERVLVTWVTGNYFPLLDIRPALGRFIRPEEGGRGRVDPIVVLGYSAWQRRFGGDPSIVGKIVRVNGHACTVVGVGPPAFAGTFAFSESELYLPLNWSVASNFDDRRARGLHAIARLRRGVSIDSAQATMTIVAKRLADRYPASNANVTIRVVPERLARPEEDQFRSTRSGAALMLGLVVLVMIIAAVNVTNLLMARTTGRRRELAIRAALGAGRNRLLRQLMTESLVLSALGGASGALLGTWASRILQTIRPPGDLPVRFDFQGDARVLTYTVAVALATGVLVGLVSAVRVSGVNLDPILRGSRESSFQRHPIRSFLVAAQIACCFVLLAVAGLFARSLAEAERADLGFRPEGVLNIHMDVEQLGYTEAQGRIFFDEVERRVRSIPGIQKTSFAFTIPMGYVRASTRVEAEGQSPDGNKGLSVGKNVVSSEYFDVMGIEIISGRSFGDADNVHSGPVAIVNQHLAELLWPGRSPIGQRLRSIGLAAPWFEVVGVTRTGKYQLLFEDPRPYMYVPIAQQYTPLRVLQVRTSMPPEALAPAVERTIGALEPKLPLYDVQSMAKALESGPGFFPARIGAIAAGAFGLLALALAVIGLYGVVSYATSQRTHEIGVRMAVGATRRDIVRLVLNDGSKVVISGVVVGLLVTLACSRIVGRLLFGISPQDAITLGTVAPVLATVALIACAIPAWRAAHIDPMTTLRFD